MHKIEDDDVFELKQTEIIDRNVEMMNKQKLFLTLQNAWNTFNKYFVYILIAILLGIYIGVTVSKTYFNDKMEDCIKIQGLVFKNQVYSITLK